MPIYQVTRFSLDQVSSRAIHNSLPYNKQDINEFIAAIETYIEDYYSVVKRNLDIPKAKDTALKLESSAKDINKVLNDLQSLPAFGIPLLKAKASFSGLGYLPEILDRTREDLMNVRDLIYWATDNIHGEANEDALFRLRTLISNITKLYKSKFNQLPNLDEDGEFYKLMRIVYVEIEIPYSKMLTQKVLDNLLEEDLATKY